jgi:hypothetical protein
MAWAIYLQLQEWADYWRQQGYTEEQVAEWLAETVAAAAAPAEAPADSGAQADPAAAADAPAEQGVDPEALQTAVATAQWVDTTAAPAAPAAEAAYAIAPLAAPIGEPDSLDQEHQFGDAQPQVDQTPMQALHPQHQQTPGTGATEYHTPAAEGGEAVEQAARAAARGVPGQLGHVVSLGAAWLKQRASSHASDTTGR